MDHERIKQALSGPIASMRTPFNPDDSIDYQSLQRMELLPYGCQGYLSTFITFRPEVTRAYWRAISANDISAAVTIIERIDRPFFDYILNSKGGFDAAMHGIMELSGLAQRWRRKPFYSLADEEMERLSQFLNTLAAAGKGLTSEQPP